MGRAEAGTPKAIANAIKAKGELGCVPPARAMCIPLMPRKRLP